MYVWNEKLLVVDLGKKAATIEAISPATLKKYKGIDALAKKYLNEKNAVIMAGPLTGLLGPCTNRYGVYTKGAKGTLGGFFGAELKLCGFDGIILQGKAKEPTAIIINDDAVEFISAKALTGQSTDEKVSALMKYYPVKAGTLVTGVAAEKGCQFACVMGDRLYSGAAGTGVAFAKMNLMGIAVSGHGIIEVANPEKYGETALAARKKVANSKFAIALGSADAKVSNAVAVNLQARPLAGYKHIERSLDWENAEGFKVTGRRGCYGCTIGCRKQYKISKAKYKGLVESPAPEFAQVFEDECAVKEVPALLIAYELCRQAGMDPVQCAAYVGKAMKNAKKSGDAQEMLSLIEKATVSGKITETSSVYGYNFAAVKNATVNQVAEDAGMCPFAAAMLSGNEIKAMIKYAAGKECEINGR